MTTTTNQMTDSSQDGAIKSFNQRLREIFHPGIKLSPQEEAIMNILYKILGTPGTIKVTPRVGDYYIVNSNIHYFVKITPRRVLVVNTTDSISRNITETVAAFMQEAVDREIQKDVDMLEKTIFSNEMSILNKITEKIENEETSHNS